LADVSASVAPNQRSVFGRRAVDRRRRAVADHVARERLAP
jgi:hypothetical protein